MTLHNSLPHKNIISASLAHYLQARGFAVAVTCTPDAAEFNGTEGGSLRDNQNPEMRLEAFLLRWCFATRAQADSQWECVTQAAVSYTQNAENLEHVLNNEAAHHGWSTLATALG